MPRNGSGTYTLPEPPFVAGTVISSAVMNDDLSDIATALTGSLPRDGQVGMLGQLKATDGALPAPGFSFNNETNSGFYRASAGVIGVVINGLLVSTFNSSGLNGQMPISAVIDLATATIPTGWLLCFGQAVPRATYAALFALIGTVYGAGNGSTTFNLPDLRGIVIFGKNDMGGSASSKLTSTFYGADPNAYANYGGSQSSQLITANLPAYTPTGTVAVTNGSITINGTAMNIAGLNNNNGGGGGAFAAGSSAASLTASQAGSTASFTGAAAGGTQTLFSNIPPGLVMNKIIFAGV